MGMTPGTGLGLCGRLISVIDQMHGLHLKIAHAAASMIVAAVPMMPGTLKMASIAKTIPRPNARVAVQGRDGLCVTELWPDATANNARRW
jgi:hypothetical protein